MGLSTLNGHTVTRARVTIPKWGLWYAEASIDREQELAGAVTLVIGDLTLRGTILSGGPQTGRASFRIVAGAGGWGRKIGPKNYATDAGVKVATVLGDAAREVGETLAPISPSQKTGTSWTRDEGAASKQLELLAPQAWYVDEAGVTRLGARPRSELVGQVTRITPVDQARQRLTLAADKIAPILPGLVVDGLTVVDVLHELTPEGLRSTVWGSLGGGKGRQVDELRALLEQLLPDYRFRGWTEYRVVTVEGDRLNLQAVRVSAGMPDQRRVVVRPGVAGCKSTFTPGARVLVSFVDGDPSRPFVGAAEDADGNGFLPLITEIDATTAVKLGLGVRPAAGAGDLAGIFPIVPTQTKVLI